MPISRLVVRGFLYGLRYNEPLNFFDENKQGRIDGFTTSTTKYRISYADDATISASQSTISQGVIVLSYGRFL